MPPQFMYGFIYGVLLIISGLMFPRSHLVLLQTRKQTEYSALDNTPVCSALAITPVCSALDITPVCSALDITPVCSVLDITPVCMSNAFTDGCEPKRMFYLYQIYQC